MKKKRIRWRIRRGVTPNDFVHRRLALMFTDIVGSTPRVVEVGDERWLALLARHNDLLRSSFAEHRGREMCAMGDGFLAVFDEPCLALRCARHIHARLRDDAASAAGGTRVRIGIQWADVLETADGYVGRGVHEAARISELADGDEVLVSVALLRAAREPFPPARVRSVELRGLPGRYDLVSISATTDRRFSQFAGSLART